ncbi:MAG: ammonia-forming cytochrome c nitrite reductase subunit c552 [Pseudomonadota bacterium]
MSIPPNTRSPHPAALLLVLLSGMLLGVGGFTFHYSEGLSYLSADPAACVNCHIMRPQFEGWLKGSHHSVAVCVDCHLPHDLVGKYLAKAENGYHHSRGFTLQDFHEPIMIKPKNEEILFEQSYTFSYQDLSARLHELGHAHPVSCVDCHDPDTMHLRVTRPGFIRGIQALADSEAPVLQLPSLERWRQGPRAEPYDPNTEASRTEMRSYVCGQCHVEYYCSSKMPLEFPWGKGLKAEDVEARWDATTFSDGQRFFDYAHKESGAVILKAQHPEFELWSQGVHARSGVACADCHMPYMRDGAAKVSDHWVRSPLLNVNRACQACHHLPEEEIQARVEGIQQRNFDLLQRGGVAITDLLDAVLAAQQAGATPAQLAPALELQRKAQWRLDFIAAENSMGFHAPQEAARILGEALDYTRQGQIAAVNWRAGGYACNPSPWPPSPRSSSSPSARVARAWPCSTPRSRGASHSCAARSSPATSSSTSRFGRARAGAGRCWWGSPWVRSRRSSSWASYCSQKTLRWSPTRWRSDRRSGQMAEIDSTIRSLLESGHGATGHRLRVSCFPGSE